MDLSIWPVILAGVATIFGAYGTFQGQRTANANKRFEMLFGFQGETIQDVKEENKDLRIRLAEAEKNIMLCEKDQHAKDLKIMDLERKVAELQRLIPNGTTID